MTLEHRKLPYAFDALEPHYPEKLLRLHYEKHHRGYVDKANTLLKGTPWENADLETIIRESAGKAEHKTIFNNVAQIWNHDAFWVAMKPGGGGAPSGAIADLINGQLGGYDAFRKAFKDCAINQFGSGWAWLALDGGKPSIVSTSNAETPITKGSKVVITLDVWEHAYYVAYENRRPDFVDAFFDKLISWDAANKALASA